MVRFERLYTYKYYDLQYEWKRIEYNYCVLCLQNIQPIISYLCFRRHGPKQTEDTAQQHRDYNTALTAIDY